jgi:anti-sigma factor RsiW
MSPEEQVTDHLQSWEVAGFLDRSLSASEQSRIEAHLADCEECRAEVVEVADLLRTQPRGRRYLSVGLAAAAAAILVVLVWPHPENRRTELPGHREPPLTTSVAPTLVRPHAATTAVTEFVWTSVPQADRYRLALFDDAGVKVWETQTRDTSVAFPEGIHLRQGSSYFWKVEARTGWDRWVDSDLADFSVGPPRP